MPLIQNASDEIKEKLIKLLREIFQFENEDLDFGIYKILNYKKKEIAQFIKKDLIEEINKQLNLIGSEEQKKALQESEELKSHLIDLGIEDYEQNPKYKEKKKQIAAIKVSEDLEKEIFNHIYTFFSRYYDKGDFISKRRYGKNNKYAVPYNGEETLLYWANNDQYYVKTSEYFKEYSFKVGGLKVNFRILEAEEENGNEKSQENKFFIVNTDKIFDFTDKEIDIYFQYRALEENEKKSFGERANQDLVNKHNFDTIKGALEKEAKELFIAVNGTGSTALEVHLSKYTRRNTYDYFIHKNLQEFFERELDFYIKNEVVDLSDVTKLNQEQFNRYVLEVKVIRSISNKIIQFLSQIENFQKKIWEKKKFVLKTDYVITLDRVPEEFQEEILKNKEQLKEWKELFSVEIKSAEDLIESNTLNGKIHKKLPIDTKHFSEDFKEKLLAKLTEKNGLDELLNGVLIKSENFQALNFLLEKYRGRVKCIYIDPPYNTGNDDFLYKDDYFHSSWLSMIENRLFIAKELLSDKGVLFISIDDNEAINLQKLLGKIFGEQNFVSQITIQTNKGGQDYLEIAKTHEYLICYVKSDEAEIMEIPKETIDFKYQDKKGKFEIRELRNRNPKFHRGNRPNLYFPIYVNRDLEDKDGFCPISLSKLKEYQIETFPKNSVGRDSCWRWGKELISKNIILNDVEGSQVIAKQKSGGGWNVYEKNRKSTQKVKSIWDEKDVRTENGTIRIRELFNRALFTHPKPKELIEKAIRISATNNDIVMDFFAGSGTTVDAVISLNQKDKMDRKVIMVEIGSYFESIALPRAKKVLLTSNWENGKPQDTKGIGGAFKYHYLEQYEDALENIEFTQKKLPEFNDYFVNYMLDFESRDSKTFLNIDNMEDPFNYKIKIIEDYEQKTTTVDLVETYNYLMGLEVKKIQTAKNKNDENRKYIFVEGKRENKEVLVIWRNIKDFDANKDKDFIRQFISKRNFDEVHINGNNILENSILIEEQFKKLMND